MEETRMRPVAVGELVFVLGRHEPRARHDEEGKKD